MVYVAGTTSFMAPELLEARTDPSLSSVDKRPSDIFALGCICYEVRAPAVTFDY
jgi:serine/threonine protein kinase